ncbi:hypothetical protein Har1130_19000 [Haloarcula sp. CBA1130]|uniref:hypothetical protein n=1 Tax=unclassified Haloarcula TaxID=2624677 RepID=UPI00124729D8|nr:MULTISPECIES: hypothetical protein [unclassified Haloarcula]KAA9396369.1 hypothetical protein Har1130_19000 [Haloarcula sp. CBA1130]KAA9397459.1 hypothetical protein Har1129_04015 [Haloarcula sp. CBA1129]
MPRQTNPNNDGTDDTATDKALADHLDMDIEQDGTDTDDLQSLVSELDDEVSPPVSSVLETLVTTIDDLQARVDDLEADLEQTHEVATTAVGDAAENESRLNDVETQQETTHDIAKSAIAKAQQLEADTDQQEDAEQLPEGIEPSSSPLDFFANCRQSKVKTMFVERSNRQNTYRAIAVAKRWPEFATKRTDGSGVFMTKADLQTALTAELGKEPHRQTIKRVWETLVELGGDDIVEKTRQVGRDQTKTEILAMDMKVAEGLLEKRYIGLDLLENSDHKAATGGVTPVVVESSA